MIKRLIILGFCFLGLLNTQAFSQVEPLPADQAFQFSAMMKNNHTIITMWKIKPGYHLYRSRFHFKSPSKQTRLGQPNLPYGIENYDPALGDYQIYTHSVKITIPIIKHSSDQLILTVHYQGCSSKGFCYPPINKSVRLNLKGPYLKPVSGQPIAVIANNSASHLLQRHSWPLMILGFLIFGLFIAFTPCVLPMIPILSSIIVGQKKLSFSRGLSLSIAYVLGMALTYAAAGVFFGFMGSNLQTLLQTPSVIIAFSILFALLALSLLGFYQIQLPQSWRNKLSQLSHHQKGGSFFGTMLMGCLSTLILSPCVTPPLVAALTYISNTGNALTGGVALFAMGIGAGIPLLVIGSFGAKYLPKTGAWMDTIKQFLAVVLLGLAIWNLQRLYQASWLLILWALLFFGCAIALDLFAKLQKNWRHLIKKIIAIIFFVYAIILVVGAVQGQNDILQPLRLGKKQTHSQFTIIHNLTQLKQQLAQAKKHHQWVVLDFYANWCLSCKVMDRTTFANPQVKKALHPFLLLRADITRNNSAEQALMHSLNVIAPPTILFFNTHGEEIKTYRIVGELSAKDMLEHLENLKKDIIKH